MISDAARILMFGGSTANYEKPVFYSQTLNPAVSNHINGVYNNTGEFYGVQLAGSAGFFRIYKSPSEALLINNPNTSFDLYTSAGYYGAVFGAGFYGFATGSGGSFIKNSSNTVPSGSMATVQRLAVTGQTGNIIRSFPIDQASAVVFGGSGQISTGGGLGGNSSSTTWTARSSGTSQQLMAGAIGRARSGDDASAFNRRMMIVGSNGAYTWSEDTTTWFASRFQTSTATMMGVSIADNMIVAVGTGGTIFTCDTNILTPSSTLSDPNVWTQCFSPVSTTLRAVCSPYIDSPRAGSSSATSARRRFWVAVGDGGVILSSPDGFNWTQCVSPTTTQLNCVMASSYFGAYVVGGQNGTFLVGNDGT